MLSTAPALLAQATPDATAATAWLIGLAAALVIIDRILAFFKSHMQETPRPADTYATKREHGELRQTLSQHIDAVEDRFQTFESKLEKTISDGNAHRTASNDRLETKIDSLAHDTKEDIKGLHKRIDPLVAGVSKIIGQLEK